MAYMDTGCYLLRHYDRYGRPLKDFDQVHRCVTEACEAGQMAIGNDGIASFSVDRRIFNSLDDRQAWGVK